MNQVTILEQESHKSHISPMPGATKTEIMPKHIGRNTYGRTLMPLYYRHQIAVYSALQNYWAEG